jgi:hypothetical protein
MDPTTMGELKKEVAMILVLLEKEFPLGYYKLFHNRLF